MYGCMSHINIKLVYIHIPHSLFASLYGVAPDARGLSRIHVDILHIKKKIYNSETLCMLKKKKLEKLIY